MARVRGEGRRKERRRCIEGSMRGREGGEEEEGTEEEKGKYKRFEKKVKSVGRGEGREGEGEMTTNYKDSLHLKNGMLYILCGRKINIV